MQRNVLALSVAGLAGLALAAFAARGGWQGGGGAYAAGALLGGAAGFALYHASFGFTAAWRRMVRERRGAGLRAQMLLLAIACAGTFLLIGYEDATGIDMRPVIMPMGVASAFGAVLFGIGMQLGGGCASGTLFTVGGGSTRMTVVLAFFIAGSVWATAHIPGFWAQLDRITGIPNIPGTSLIALFGPLGGLAALLLVLGAIWVISAAIERHAHGTLETTRPSGSLLRGPWSMEAGAVALALVSIGCFLVFQQPWGITSGFALWGAKILEAAGGDVAAWPYWQGWRADQLRASVLADAVSVMNFGIVLGALAASALAGRFAPVWRLSARELLTAVIGGLLMGYGARLAYGCNIGAYLGGLVSGSMHGFWWLVWGFAGSAIGTRLRAALAMDPPVPARSVPA
ncbi:YeeE/YedE family protein [Limibaculum sp. FT325]|uniref:YeeE/YedE family protein n=1 Tax=Thermohalobaculum sediminis TaxID=2939436 RepID=UPI0020C0862B|nr:YeeE/YedE family protein [Limibaculum sediminis]MCL5779165.1 YeeE/YedE family protein [Limibaculum sediminis]